MSKIVVGLSGGVDSFVTALLLQQQGFEVIGVNLKLWDTHNVTLEEENLNELCAGTRIPLHRVDGRELFKKTVVSPFVNGYLTGITPNPCAVCNSFVKWNLLRTLADELGIYHIATGHYVRILPFENHHYVHKGIDPNKDQSYFLWGVSEDILSRAITPLGDYTKTQVKEIARQQGYTPLADKRESMSICFLEGGDYRDFIACQPGTASCFTPGLITDESGAIIGNHEGLAYYTVGQKRGIPLHEGHPRYVTRIDPASNRIIVSEKSALNRTTLTVGQVHFINPNEISSSDIEVKVRGLGLNPEGHARLLPKAGNTVSVQLSSPAWAVAPGQPAAFYRQERVIGGGIIL